MDTPSEGLRTLAEDKTLLDEEALKRIKIDIPSWFEAKLPQTITERGLPFTCVVMMVAREGKGQELLARMTEVHDETDEKELSVYSHRLLRGYVDDADENKFCIIIEYDEPQAFVVHYNGDAINDFYNANILKCPPVLSFYYEL